MSNLFDTWQTVVPAPARVKEAARELLAIAGDSSLVRTDGNGTTFLVPAWVAEMFVSPPASETVEAPKPKRTRARKEES